MPAPRGLPPLVPPLVPAEPKPEPAESELAVAVDPRVGGTVGRLLPIARAEEAGSGAGPRRDDVAALPGAARPAALPSAGSLALPRAGSR